jgi:spore coat polysaccharide biosynthesis protein SpsF
MNVGAIIQARMGSTRLPGKVLVDIEGQSMLARVVDRTRRAATINRVIVATTDKAKDDELASHAEGLSVDVYRGDEDDVLDRYYQAAASHGLDVIVRITSDCPLLDPGLVDQVVSPLLDPASGVEFSANILDRAFPRGLDVEAATAAALARVWRTARAPHHRAHTFAYVYDHRDEFSTASITDGIDRADMRWTVDTTEDLSLVREIYRRLGTRDFSWHDVLALVEQDADLLRINNMVRQKPAHEL